MDNLIRVLVGFALVGTIGAGASTIAAAIRDNSTTQMCLMAAIKGIDLPKACLPTAQKEG